MSETQRPRPVVEPLTAPFGEAARRGQLVVQHCSACARWQHPPAPACHGCGGSAHLAYQPVSGNARLVSWTVTHQALVAGFSAALPYVNLLVELDEQAGLLMVSDTVSAGMPTWPLRVGTALRVAFETLDASCTLPQFRPTQEAA